MSKKSFEDIDKELTEKRSKLVVSPDVPVNPESPESQLKNSFTILNGKKIGASQRTTIAANLIMLGFRRLDANEIFPLAPWTRSMYSKTGGISINFTTTSDLGSSLRKFMWDADFKRNSAEANRLEFGNDRLSHMLLASHSLEPRLAEFSFLKHFREVMIKENTGISFSFMSATSVYFEENGHIEEVGLKEILTDYPELAKIAMNDMTNMGQNLIKFLARPMGFDRDFWK